jgi:hypothetical protein
MPNLREITAEKFQSLIGTKAVLAIDNDKTIELSVTKVFDQTLPADDARPNNVKKDPFIIQLSGAHSDQASDGTYAISFEEVGTLELFVDNKSDDPDSEDFKYASSEANAEPKAHYHIVIG